MDIKIFSSSKEGDDDKRNAFVRIASSSHFTDSSESNSISVVSITPKEISGLKLSATQVRKAIYKNILTDDKSHFLENDRFINFYGEKRNILYDEIDSLVNRLYESSDKKEEFLQYYIDNGEIKKNNTTRKRKTDNDNDSNSNKRPSNRKSTKKTGGRKKTRKYLY